MINHTDFPGCDWSPTLCDELAIKFVPISLLAEESELFSVKHWDYRFLHPTQATQLFAHSYAQAKKHAVERRTDIWIGRNMRGIKEPVIFDLDARSITGFWKGRQMADRLGIPYDFYCENAMFFADVARWENLPTPIQMYSQNVPEHLKTTNFAVSMVEFVGLKWAERMDNMNNYASHEAYLAENYRGGDHQNAYLNYLGEKIKESAYPEAVLASVMEKGQVSPDLVRRMFPKTGNSLLRRAEVLLE